MVVDGVFDFSGKRKQQLLEEFEGHGFVQGAYEYLLSMPMWNLTHEKKESLEKELAQKAAELALLKSTSPENLWRKDLQVLRQKITLTTKRGRDDTVSSNKRKR